MRKKILSIFLTIFMVMALFPTKSKAVTEYSLWVGGTQVTEANKDNILGDGTCSFDSNSNTLTLNNANITGGYSTHNIHVNNGNISDLKISLKGTNSLNGQSIGVYSYYTNLTIDGSQGGTLETTGSISGIQASFASITIKNVDNLYAKSSGPIFGLYAIAGNSSPHALKIENSTVTAHSDENAGIRTYTKPFIITGNSNVTASTNSDSSVAMSFANGISLEDGLGVLDPAGGTIDSTTIKNPDGTTAKTAIIGKQYDITTSVEPSGSGTITSEGAYIDDHTVTLTATPAEGYRFVNWTEDGEEVSTAPTYSFTVTKSRDLVANFEQLPAYTIRFVNEDGTELQSGSVTYGETPTYTGETPTKEASEQYTYNFLAWTPSIVPVTTDAVYKATYSSTVNEYTIRFVNEDGTELQSSSVAYGETPVYTGETPTKPDDDQYTYTFAGWDPEITSVTGDATYTATYSAEDKTEHSKSESDGEDVSEVTSDDEETPKSDVSKTETKEQETYDAPNTGDEANVLPLTSLLIMSLLCLIYIFLNKRKYKYSK